MDKNTYETYEYVPANSSDGETDQFLVVQDDGTFLLNREIQYITQTQDAKESFEDVQTCTVYGVSQQFFVDVDNSTELIPVSDQFILPETQNSLLTNSYLLHSDVSNTTEQIEPDVITESYTDQQNAHDINIVPVIHNSTHGNDFTEVTLSDEQYQILEHKGWILIECNDKIYVLNPLGLHDITSNTKLIEKLQNELRNDPNAIVKTEMIDMNQDNTNNDRDVTVLSTVLSEQHGPVELMLNVNGNTSLDELNSVTNEQDNTQTPCEIEESKVETIAYEEPMKQEHFKQNNFKDTSSIKIKTNYVFKDIPEKIFLGRTVNGKRLVAKVKKLQTNKDNIAICNTKPPEDPPSSPEQKQLLPSPVAMLHESDFINVVQKTMKTGFNMPSPENLASARNVVAQLLKVAAVKNTLLGKDLLVTKISNKKNVQGKIYSESRPTLVTGRIVSRDDSTAFFEHVPQLLQHIQSRSETDQSGNAQIDSVEDSGLAYFYIYHVHTLETRCDDENVLKVFVTLDKRQLPVNLVFDFKRLNPNIVFACSACAALFKTEDALKHHQESHSMDTEDSQDTLTIDTAILEDRGEPIKKFKSGTDTLYVCTLCNVRFTKLCNCQRHIKIHDLKTEPSSESDKTQAEDPRKELKCPMCPISYTHSSSLAKHIITSHIKLSKNNK